MKDFQEFYKRFDFKKLSDEVDYCDEKNNFTEDIYEKHPAAVATIHATYITFYILRKYHEWLNKQ